MVFFNRFVIINSFMHYLNLHVSVLNIRRGFHKRSSHNIVQETLQNSANSEEAIVDY